MSLPRPASFLQRVAAGDAEAVQGLIQRYGGLVWSLLRRQLGSHAAEDVAQDVFIALWRDAARFDPALASEEAFVAMITRRRLIDHKRRLGLRPQSTEIDEDLPVFAPADESVEQRDQSSHALRALAALRPEQARVLRMALLEGLTHQEIAVATALPLGTVKSHARRGLERVRCMLGAATQTTGATLALPETNS